MFKIFSKYISLLLLEQDFDKSYQIQNFLDQRNSIRAFHVVRDGIEAVDFILNESCIANPASSWLILVNLNLPYAKEVLNEIRNNSELKTIPVVIFTEKDENTILQNYNLPSNYYIVEPDNFAKCQEIIETMEHFQYFTKSMKENISHKHLSYML